MIRETAQQRSVQVPVTQTIRIYGFYFVYVMGAGIVCGVDNA